MLTYIDFNNSPGKYPLKDNLVIKITYEDKKYCSKLFKLKSNNIIDVCTTTFDQFDNIIQLDSQTITEVDSLNDIIGKLEDKNKSDDEFGVINLNDI